MSSNKQSLPDIRQTVSYAKYLKSQGWIVERIDNINYFVKKIPLLGSILKIQRPQKLDWDGIDVLIHRYKPFQIIIEPANQLQAVSCMQYDYKLSKSPYLPSKTIQINLTQTKEQIFRNFTKSARYSIKRGEKQKIKEHSTPQEIKIFHDAWKRSAKFNRYVPSLKTFLNLKKSFPNNTSIFLASHNIFGNIIGGALFTISSHENQNFATYYMYGFTNKEGRTSLSQYALLYQGILWGKKMGCKIFDMEGIYDDRFPIKSWLGFTHFKKQFGGSEVLYPGCYTKFRLPF